MTETDTNTMTTVSFMTAKDYKATLQQDVGSLMFSGDYYDAGRHIDKTKLRKTFKTELEGKRIYAVLIHTDSSKGFKNYANTQIRYKNPMFCSATSDGAYTSKNGFTVYDQPVGDAIVVYTEIAPKDVPSASKLKSLRKEWNDLEDAWSKHLEEEQRGQKCGEYEGRKEYIQQSRKTLKDTIGTPMLEIGKVLMKHDTPFIQRKVSTFAWIHCNMKWNEDWVQE
jgi:hypothetical protein